MLKTIILAMVVLSACTNINFDAGEYDRYITIKQLADNSVSMCGSPELLKNVIELKKYMDHQYLYAINRTSRPQLQNAAKNLKQLIDETYYRTKPGDQSITYCQYKLKHVSDSTDIIIKVLGGM